MPRPSDKDRVANDQTQVNRASKNVYDKWAERWSCDLLEQYYYGEQWEGDSQNWSQRKYVINLFYPSINISKPSTLFQIPKYKVTPRMARLDDPASDVEARAKLQEETLNTFVQDPKLGFAIEAGLCLLDANFRFAVMQVGYTNDFIDNPNKGRPMLSTEVDPATGERKPMIGKDGQPAVEADYITDGRSEGLFFKWIPAKNFRVSERNGNRNENCDWVGYFEWSYIDDLKANPRYKNTSNLKSTGRLKGEKPSTTDEQNHPGMVKVWFLWDLRSKSRRVFVEGHDKYLLEESFSFLPLVPLKFDEILGQWLPLPPTYNWVHPQNQLNDIREMRRIHRKRAVRRYLRKNGAIDEEEWNKLCEADDMGSAVCNGDPEAAVKPMPDAQLDPAVFRDEATMLEDFTRTSGVSGESQQVAQSETATQANLIALLGQTRENAKRMVVALWLSAVGRVVLMTLREKMALPFWIKKSVDPSSELAAMEAMEVAQLWQQITAEQLGDIDNDITVDIASMSPIQQEQERANWMTFLQVMTNPSIGLILSVSPALMRKTASLFNITSERDLLEVSQAMQTAALLMAGGGGGQGMSGMGAQPQPAPGPTPGNDAIANQIEQQLPQEMLQ